MASNSIYEDSIPDPEHLIKSIAEQGYSLETSLADLMDNSISANADKIEVLIKMDEEPFVLFLSDNGDGMDENTLKLNMKFPSKSSDTIRNAEDMGRFGLGMKAASFSQTRCLTVISRKRGSKKYAARTWDVDYLRVEGWKIKINTDQEIDELIKAYNNSSYNHLKQFPNYEPNTIVVWKGLFKFEEYILDKKNRQDALKKEISEITTDYLSLVFHRFMERQISPLKIRINNNIIIPFNPFPTNEKDFRPIQYKQRNFQNANLKMEGFILPSRSIDQSRNGLSIWTTKNRGLMDMEGIYIYRADRIILFGNWLGLIKKGPKLQLARLRVEVDNSVDHLLHLNVAKSQITIPFELKSGFEAYIEELKLQAEKEFYNRGTRTFLKNKKIAQIQLFERKASNKGTLLLINTDFPILKSLENELNPGQLSNLNIILRMINTRINKIRHIHEDQTFTGKIEDDDISMEDLIKCILQLKQSGFSSESIKTEILPNLGYNETTYPISISELLKN